METKNKMSFTLHGPGEDGFYELREAATGISLFFTRGRYRESLRTALSRAWLMGELPAGSPSLADVVGAGREWLAVNAPGVAAAPPVDILGVVREGMERRGWTNLELSRRTGISTPLVSQFLGGRGGLLIPNLERVFDALGITLGISE